MIRIAENDPLKAMNLPANYEILQYALNHNIFLKKASNNYITNLDREIIWHIKEGRFINFPHLMMKVMKRKYRLLYAKACSNTVKHKGMPYGALITKILKEHKVPLKGEEKIPFPHNWRVISMNLNNMKTKEKGWMYGLYARSNGYTLENE